MSEQDLFENAGPKFFGKICAAVSHEIKNNLAIIGQQSGLIDDLLLMSEQGMALDPARLKKLSLGIAEQVRRADEVVKRLNRFAHSVDEPYCSVNLKDVLSLLMALCQRFASVKGVQLEQDLSEEKLEIVTSPFFLEHLLFLCLNSVMANLENGAKLLVSMKDAGTSAVVTFSATPSVTPCLDGVDEELSTGLLRRLNAQITINGEIGDLVLSLPRKLTTVSTP